MAILILRVPQCDFCEHIFSDMQDEDSCHNLRRRMKEGGWKKVGKKDMCYRCIQAEERVEE